MKVKYVNFKVNFSFNLWKYATREYEDHEETDLIESSIKAPGAAEGRFFLRKDNITLTNDITTVSFRYLTLNTFFFYLLCKWWFQDRKKYSKFGNEWNVFLISPLKTIK